MSGVIPVLLPTGQIVNCTTFLLLSCHAEADRYSPVRLQISVQTFPDFTEIAHAVRPSSCPGDIAEAVSRLIFVIG